MIPNFLSAIWAAVAAAMGNHLWQSTLCLVIVGLLTLVLRKNRAQARYGLWLAASIKFLIPFSLLIAMGSHLARPRVVPRPESGVFVVMEQVGQPFALPAASAISRRTQSASPARLVKMLPAFLVGVWFCGFVAVVFLWNVRWQKISAILRKSTPLREGREVDALRRQERVAGMRKPIELKMSTATLEPGIFGIVKPVLIWPQGIAQHLSDAHLEAILAHEVWHVRRRDNLAAAIHMLVEAIFWFHPLVWWLGARMVEERERACDEKVLQLGSEPHIYAESILKTCEFCLESPLVCVSGVTGADLKKRIVRIMTPAGAGKLSFGRKVLLAAVGGVAVAGPLLFGTLYSQAVRAQSAPITGAPLPSFEVASIKPDRSGDVSQRVETQPTGLRASGATAKHLVAAAYHVLDYQVSGGPSWVNTDRYSIQAKVDDSLIEEMRKLPLSQQDDSISPMLQSLLIERFRLKITQATKDVPAYALIVAKNGPKLRETKPGDMYLAEPESWKAHAKVGLIAWRDRGASMAGFAQQLSRYFRCPVLDRTGVSGSYDFWLEFTGDRSQPPMLRVSEQDNPRSDSGPPPDSSGPSIFTALQEQLGLKLEPTKGPVEVLVIDHIERPSEN